MFTNYLHTHSAIGFLSEFIWQGKACYFSHLKDEEIDVQGLSMHY